MIKKYIFIITIFFIISCSYITPISKYNIDEIKSISIKKIYENNKDEIRNDRIRISKNGYGKWYILAYGNLNNYDLILDEEGNILKYEIIKFE